MTGAGPAAGEARPQFEEQIMTRFRWSRSAAHEYSGCCSSSWDRLPARPGSVAAVAAPPERLTDAEFWKLVTDISEPDGYFRITDNFTSNEPEIGQIATMLRDTGVTGRRVPGRRSRAKPVLHRGDPSGDGVRDRHPASGRDAAPDVQGHLRALDRPRGFHFAPVLEATSRRDRTHGDDPADLERI